MLAVKVSELKTATTYSGSTAQWCKGGCGKFRYPRCLLNGQPICAECTFRLKLQIAQTKHEQRRTPKDGKGNLPPQPHRQQSTRCPCNPIRRIKYSKRLVLSHLFVNAIVIAYQLVLIMRQLLQNYHYSYKLQTKNRGVRTLADRLLSGLVLGPRLGLELAQTMGCNHLSLASAARKLVKEGLVISQKEANSRGAYWYALPKHKERLHQLSGQDANLRNLIFRNLEIYGPKTTREMQDLLPDHCMGLVARILSTGAAKGQLLVAGRHLSRLYALPSQEKQWREMLRFEPKERVILEIIRKKPGIWINEVARQAQMDFRTAHCYLKQLEAKGQITLIVGPKLRHCFREVADALQAS